MLEDGRNLIIALDISLKNTGYAVLNKSDDGRVNLIESGHMVPANNDYGNIGKSLYLARTARQLYESYSSLVGMVAAEQGFVANSGNTTLALAGARMSVLVSILDCIRRDIYVPFVDINNISVKSAIAGNSRAPKWWVAATIIPHITNLDGINNYAQLLSDVASIDAKATENKAFKVFRPYFEEWGLGHWQSFDVTDAVAVGVYTATHLQEIMDKQGNKDDV